MRIRSALLILFAMACSALLSGCGQEAKVPDVVGIQLDKAHQQLDKAALKKHKDKDLFGDRSIVRDANWVVLEQDPASGKIVGTDTQITLRVGKIGEAQTTERLPEGSPVLAKVRADQAEKEAAERAQDAKDAAKRLASKMKRAKAVLAYVNAVDPILRLAQRDFPQFKALAADIRSGKVRRDALVLEVADAHLGLTRYQTRLEAEKPDSHAGRNQVHRALLAALETFDQAVQTLLSADGATRTASLARFDTVYTTAVAAWNADLKRLYDTTNVPVPLIH